MKDNRRDYDRSKSNNRRPSYNSNSDRTGQNILPSSRVLEGYESVSPGSVNKLLDMAKKEQEHRHSWQDKYSKSHNFSYRAGQLFGLIYNLALLVLIFVLVKNDDKDLALKLFIANAILIILALIVTSIERKVSARKPPRRNNYRSGSNRPARVETKPDNK